MTDKLQCMISTQAAGQVSGENVMESILALKGLEQCTAKPQSVMTQASINLHEELPHANKLRDLSSRPLACRTPKVLIMVR